ncbi:hypothetical protein [Variovorax ginsengisoli]|uniref:Uncharacterized protein n=1 Tax=Variovorax ginsengisoli TaxID=363844 RepID=A0ABT8S7W9_9BURK|nr:hypothetical protein [Variovorax ginsengisoli]MDN8615832.1 hypothetical protein [Variovorax ginsengisoli]MDO1535002.1 hypothetical protein [Variovorax ginsengisoli]
MATDTPGMGSAFNDWQALSLAYEAAIESLRRREPGAGEVLRKISRELQTCEGANAERSAAAKHQ